MLRRLVTFGVVAVGTAAGALWWLGGEPDAVALGVDGARHVGWDADGMARDAGIPVTAPEASETP